MNFVKKFFLVWKKEGPKTAFKKAFYKVFKKSRRKEKHHDSEINSFVKPPQASVPSSKEKAMSKNPISSLGPKVITPYLMGPESKKSNRVLPYHFAAGLMDYDVVSFDIFDTLVLRHLNQPTDVFMLVGEKLQIFNFVNIRINAEREVRDQKLSLFNNREVTIDEIYERVSYYTGIDAQEGIEAEIETELEMCYANPYMKRVYDIVVSVGKKIYATSNMYIPSKIMKRLLDKCGYTQFEDILVSCDYGCSKTNGELFKILKRNCKAENIVHIGDNYTVDIKGSNLAGVDSRYYKSCREWGDEHRSPGMSPLIGSAYRAMITNTLHNGTQDMSLLEEYGFVYGGAAALGFVNWINKQAKEDNVDRIFFLSRDGYVLYNIFQKMQYKIPSSYIFWSRLAAMRNVCAGEREPFLRRLITERSNKGDTIGDLLEFLAIDLTQTELFKEKFLNSNTYIISENEKIIIDYFVTHWSEIILLLENSQKYTNEYIMNNVSGAKKIALIDVGWSGKNLYPLKKLLSKNGVESVNYMLGTITKAQTATDTLNGETKCYMFNSHYNRDIHDRFCKESVAGLEAMEKLFSAAHPSFMGFNRSGEAEFCLPEEQNYCAYHEIQKGILKFVDGYVEAFKKFPCMLEISGYDAFIPVRLAFNHRKYTMMVLGQISYNFGISPNDRRPLAEVYGGKK